MYHIGVFGSAIIEEEALVVAARSLGRVLGEHDCTVVTGACSGLPYLAAAEAARCGRDVWGFSPVRSLDEQRAFVPDDDLSIYSRLIYIPASFPFGENLDISKKYRNVISTAHCDAGIIIAGRWGTLHEFCSLLDYGKVVGVLTGTGGVADELPLLYEHISKPGSAEVIFDADPSVLVARIVTALDVRARS